MNWLERYVEGVKSYLPRKKRQDVGEEILSALSDKLEAKEEELGRKLSEKELKGWIASQDHPMVRAAGYQERRELISAELFPLYLFALKIALAIVFGLKVLGTGFYILGADDFDFWKISTRLFGGLLESALLSFASITVVFHFLGRHISAKKFFDNWKVSDLPKSGAKWVNVQVGETIFEIVALVFLFAFLYGFYIDKWDISGVDLFSFNPEFYGLIPWILAAVGLGVLNRLWLALKPHWTVPKLGLSALIGLLAIGILWQVIGLDPLVNLDPALVDRHPGLGRGEWLNRILLYSLFVVFAVNLYEVGRDLYRIYRLSRKKESGTSGNL